MKPTGFAFCAHTFARISLYAQGHTLLFPRIAIGFSLQVRMSWLRALSKGRRRWRWCCGPGRWRCELAERTFKTGGGAGRALVSADCALCGCVVSWLRRLRTFLFQPVACQQVMRFCLAIWVYAGVIFNFPPASRDRKERLAVHAPIHGETLHPEQFCTIEKSMELVAVDGGV